MMFVASIRNFGATKNAALSQIIFLEFPIVASSIPSQKQKQRSWEWVKTIQRLEKKHTSSWDPLDSQVAL